MISLARRFPTVSSPALVPMLVVVAEERKQKRERLERKQKRERLERLEERKQRRERNQKERLEERNQKENNCLKLINFL
jgi:hypothetical protein